MTSSAISLIPLKQHERERFILDLQAAFQAAVDEQFGAQAGEASPAQTSNAPWTQRAPRHFISRWTAAPSAVRSSSSTEAAHCNALDLLFIQPDCHSCGAGLAAWRAIEQKYPAARLWTTVTPYFEKRNIHFYVNKCGFKIVEFFNPHHPDPQAPSVDVPAWTATFGWKRRCRPRCRGTLLAAGKAAQISPAPLPRIV